MDLLPFGALTEVSRWLFLQYSWCLCCRHGKPSSSTIIPSPLRVTILDSQASTSFSHQNNFKNTLSCCAERIVLLLDLHPCVVLAAMNFILFFGELCGQMPESKAPVLDKKRGVDEVDGEIVKLRAFA